LNIEQGLSLEEHPADDGVVAAEDYRLTREFQEIGGFRKRGKGDGISENVSMPAYRARRPDSERKILDLNVVSLPRPHNQSVNPKGYRLRIAIRGSMDDLDSTHSLLASSETAVSLNSCAARA